MKNGEHSSLVARASLTQVCKAKGQEGRFSVWERVSGRMAGRSRRELDRIANDGYDIT